MHQWSQVEIDRMINKLSRERPGSFILRSEAIHRLAVEADSTARRAETSKGPMSDEAWAEFLKANRPPSADGKLIRAERFVYRDPSTIPRRQWQYGFHRIKGFVSTTLAPGSLGKSSLLMAESLAMATGRTLLGVTPDLPCVVWYWNGEDPLEELERRIGAVLIHYRIDPAELAETFFLGSGRDVEITIATMERSTVRVAVPAVQQIIRTIRENKIDAVTIDPFVSSHRVSENDNTAIDAVVKQWAKIAHETGCSVELVHHVRKSQSGQNEFTVDDARGASALLAAARSARVLNRMTEKEGEQCRVANHFSYFRVDNGKANLHPMAALSDWYHFTSVPLGNGTPDNLLDDGDKIGVVTRWTWPDMLEDVTVAHLRQAQAAVAEGRWRENYQAKDWVGVPIAAVLGMDPMKDRKRLLAIIKTWISNKMFVIVEGTDERREKRSYVEVGEPAHD